MMFARLGVSPPSHLQRLQIIVQYSTRTGSEIDVSSLRYFFVVHPGAMVRQTSVYKDTVRFRNYYRTGQKD